MSNIWKYRSDERTERRPQTSICIVTQVSGQKPQVFSRPTGSMGPDVRSLCTNLLKVLENTFILSSSSCLDRCALPIPPDIDTSNPARLRAAARRTHTLLFKLLSRLLVSRLYVLIFHFIQGSDLKSCSLLLEEAPVCDLTLQRRQGVSTDLTLYVPFCSFLLVLSGSLLQSSRFLFSSSSRRTPRCSKAVPPAHPESASELTTFCSIKNS